MNAASAARTLRMEISNAEDKLATWGQEFLENPAYALKWSSEVFGAAARVEVFAQVVDALESLPHNPKNSLEKITAHAQRAVVRGAANPPGSSSGPSNLLDLQTTRAWAEALRVLEGGL